MRFGESSRWVEVAPSDTATTIAIVPPLFRSRDPDGNVLIVVGRR